ncbi:MAG: ligase-associated DNA damage response exonuclease [Cyanobacteria bacterium]|nr:ligase-associated DNA damage response exonuclease [Cyanobacteriota bacterium]
MSPSPPKPPLITLHPQGLYCERGGFYINPWQPVKTALITHGHGDHARAGSETYYCAQPSLEILKHRLGTQTFSPKSYGQPFTLGEVQVSFHPAGHILGSAQVRVEHEGEVWVFSGDYKRGQDPTCSPFEVVKCNTFITEATFGLPFYHWEEGPIIAQQIHRWWMRNRKQHKTSVVFCYALGKAQRILAELHRFMTSPQLNEDLRKETAFIHGSLHPLTEIYRQANIPMMTTQKISETEKSKEFEGELILAPPSAYRTPWMKRLGDVETAFVSGWMQVRGERRRAGYDAGFVMSDHADWSGLIQTIQETGAETVFATHGKTSCLVRFLNEQGIQAAPLLTDYEGEREH